MDLNKFKELRIVLKDCYTSQLNGKTCIVLFAEYNDDNEIILCTDIPHPDNIKDYLWVNLTQVAYVKVYDYWMNQYYDKTNKEFLNIPFDESKNKDLIKIGTFDVYVKKSIKDWLD